MGFYMIRCHHAGKMGDLIYALPAMRALARLNDDKIHLTTSAHCHQLAPLLWEQPYFADVVMDDARPYKMSDGIMQNWDYFKNGEGINLSPQPSFYEPTAPVSWTMCYAKTAILKKLELADYICLPSLINHRRWHFGFSIKMDGQPIERVKKAVVAPEVESLREESEEFWQQIIRELTARDYYVMVVGKRYADPIYNCHDLRGLTSVSVLARLIAESDLFIGAHSLPWHLARHSETPAICLQKFSPGLARCIPLDTPYVWYQPERWNEAIDVALSKFNQVEKH